MATKLSEHWQLDKSIIQCLQYLLDNNKEFSDVTFKLTSKDENGKCWKEVYVPALQTVLLARSPVFSAMFSGSMSNKKDDLLIIDLPDVEPDAFKQLLRRERRTNLHLAYDILFLTPNMSPFVLLIWMMILTSAIACNIRLCKTTECNDHGQCEIVRNKQRKRVRQCACNSGWEGKNCEKSTSNSLDVVPKEQNKLEEGIPIEAEEDTYSEIVGFSALGIGAAVIIALAVSITVFVLRMSSKKMDDGKHNIVKGEVAPAQAQA